MSEQSSKYQRTHETILFSFPEGFTGRMLGNDFLVTCHGSDEALAITTQFESIGFKLLPHVFELHANVISQDALNQALDDNDIKNGEVSDVVKLGDGRTIAKVTVEKREDSDKLRKYINKDVKFTKFRKLYAKSSDPAKSSNPANSADPTNSRNQDNNGWETVKSKVAKGKNSPAGRGGGRDGGYQNAQQDYEQSVPQSQDNYRSARPDLSRVGKQGGRGGRGGPGGPGGRGGRGGKQGGGKQGGGYQGRGGAY
jgi:hypothetical protein